MHTTPPHLRRSKMSHSLSQRLQALFLLPFNPLMFAVPLIYDVFSNTQSLLGEHGHINVTTGHVTL